MYEKRPSKTTGVTGKGYTGNRRELVMPRRRDDVSGRNQRGVDYITLFYLSIRDVLTFNSR